MLDLGASQTMGIIRDDYLMDERVLTRINNNYYIPNGIDSSTATEHVQRMNIELAEIFKEKYQEKIKICILLKILINLLKRSYQI